MLSVVEVCADYGGVNVFHVCLNFGVVYGVGVWVNVCGVVVCCLFLTSGCCSVVGDFCLICDACSWRCSLMGRVCVSSCICCVFVSVVHPVASLSVVFCVICSLLTVVSDANGDHMVETYSCMGLVMALHVAMIVSLCFPHVLDVSALSICIVLCAFVVVISMCLLHVSLGSRVSPSIFGLMFMGSVMSICSSSCVLYYAGSGVKRVHVVLSGLRMRLFVRVHVCISCRYDWMFALAIFMLCVDVMVMSSA